MNFSAWTDGRNYERAIKYAGQTGMQTMKPDETIVTAAQIYFAQLNMEIWRQWAKERRKMRGSGKRLCICDECGHQAFRKLAKGKEEPLTTDSRTWVCPHCALDLARRYGGRKTKYILESQAILQQKFDEVLYKVDRGRDPELKKFVKDAIRKDNVQIFDVDSETVDGVTIIKHKTRYGVKNERYVRFGITIES
jgi:hypothetical protein